MITKRLNKLKSSELQALFNKSDIVLLTETWSEEFIDYKVDGFDYFALHRVKNTNSKRSSGGIMIYIRNNLVTDDIICMQDSDDLLWIRINKNQLGISDDLFIGLCYIVPESSARYNLYETNPFDRILDSIVKIKSVSNSSQLILCGDFNSRTSDIPDFVTNDVDSDYLPLPDDYDIDISLPRFTQDKCVNNNGNLLIDMCIQSGLRI